MGSTQSQISAGFADAQAVAQETMSLIRVVTTFSTEKKEHNRFNRALAKVRKFSVKVGASLGLSMGFLNFVLFVIFGLAFYYGFKLVQWEAVSGAGQILGVLFTIIIGLFGLIFAGPAAQTLGEARGCAVGIMSVLDCELEIDNLSTKGKRPEKVDGGLALKYVEFAYPRAPTNKILHGVNIDIRPNQTVAFVGDSGCGKSTCFQLLERFYDPSSGAVELDGTDLKELNIQWYRDRVALVSQMPTLFPYTIKENIVMGARSDQIPTDEDVIAAAKLANAHDFIVSFPDGYDTLVGDLGSQLSGGQKQRIAIARAMIKKPRVLLLDEATSALDNHSEKVVQDALHSVSALCTTIAIAHRLTTIQDVDMIYVFDHGKIIESGTHSELEAAKGRYFNMLQAQAVSGETHGNTRPRVMGRTKAMESTAISTAKSDMDDSKDNKKGDEEEKLPEPPEGAVPWIIKQSAPEMATIIFATILGIIEGACFAVMGLIMGEVIPVIPLGSWRAFARYVSCRPPTPT